MGLEGEEGRGGGRGGGGVLGLEGGGTGGDQFVYILLSFGWCIEIESAPRYDGERAYDFCFGVLIEEKGGWGGRGGCLFFVSLLPVNSIQGRGLSSSCVVCSSV